MILNPNFIQRAKVFALAFIRIFYPETCALCEIKLNSEERSICHECLQHFARLKPPLCRKCAVELPPYAEISLCSHCQNKPRTFSRGASLFSFEGGIRQLIHDVKFRRKSWYLKTLRPLLNECPTPLPLDAYDGIVPVPLDRSHLREREFNQADEIARLLAAPAKASVQPLLKKIRRTEPQSLLPRHNRLKNLSGAFALKVSSVYGT